jgi:hypothetical protein
MSDVMARWRASVEHRRMIQEETSRRLAAVRARNQALRAEIPRLTAATEDLELRGDASAIAALVPRLRLECRDHFPIAESVARELLGPRVASAVPVLVEHGEVDQRLRRIEVLLPRASAEPVRDEIWREWVDLIRVLACHVCRKESGLLPLLELVARDASAPLELPAAACGRR